MPLSYVNPRVVEAQYAVRGAILTRASQLQEHLQNGEPLPFATLIYCNIGNPQALQQKPLTFFRQVMSLIDYPAMLDDDAICARFPPDAVERARSYLQLIGPQTGAYTDSAGYAWARKIVANYIARRDNTPDIVPDAGNIVLTDGASTGVRLVLQTLIAGPSDGCLIPIPQYPLYTAQMALLGGSLSKYYLDESCDWDLPLSELTSAVNDLRSRNVTPRCLVVINPGNPTGNILSEASMRDIVRFCHDNGILLMADEVYQENIYAAGRSFKSFREVVLRSPAPYNTTPTVSLHSTSKGIIGECGRRGGYFELLNVASDVKEQLIKMCAINLCSNVNGQVMTALMCDPPKKGDASFDSYWGEYNAIFESLKRRAVTLARELNHIRGVSCREVAGAMYAFPTIVVPERYVAYNSERNAADGTAMAVDARWCMELLESTGIVVVPGSGFLQKPDTLHFRTTILPPEKEMSHVTSAIKGFMDGIYAKYGQ
jgi:alanine transaminase